VAEHTRIFAPPPAPPAPPRIPAQAVYAQPAWAGAAAPAAPVLAGPAPVAGPGAFRRFLSALWSFTVTTSAVGLFVASWALAISGVAESSRTQLWAGAAATILFTPFAVHRLTGRRGRFGFMLIGSIAATATAWRLVGRGGDPAIKLAAIFGLQVLACFFMSWLTKRRIRRPEAAPGS
jgi:hypothetical protein